MKIYFHRSLMILSFKLLGGGGWRIKLIFRLMNATGKIHNKKKKFIIF